MEKNDIYDSKKQLERTLEKVRTSNDLSEKNRSAIMDFHDHCFAEGLGTPRILKYLQLLTKIATWLGADLEGANKKDIENLVMRIERMDYSDWTKHDYRVAIKKFYKWLRGSEDYPEEVKWIKTSVKNSNNRLPEELLTEEEIKKLIESCGHPRDKALVSLLYESGCRIGELCSLTMKNVSFDEYGAQIIVSGKTGMRRIRIIASTPYLASWMGLHPFKDDPNAPLWVGIGTTNKDKPLNYPSIRKMLKVLAKKAKIKKDVNPHAFRHSRATYLANRLTEAQMNQIFGWIQGSDMPSTYVHLSGRDTDDALLKIYGLKKESEEREESPLKPKKCPRCDNLTVGKFCNRCGAVLDISTAIELESRMEKPQKKLEALLEDGEVRELLARKMLELKMA